jgi:hypothetical protein
MAGWLSGPQQRPFLSFSPSIEASATALAPEHRGVSLSASLYRQDGVDGAKAKR